MKVPRKIKKKIPKGHYCYTPVEFPSEKTNWVYKTKLCPFYSHKKINGVSVPFCKFLQLGGTLNPTPSGPPESDTEKLIEHFGSDEKMWDALPLDLLWDQVKSCNTNYGKNY